MEKAGLRASFNHLCYDVQKSIIKHMDARTFFRFCRTNKSVRGRFFETKMRHPLYVRTLVVDIWPDHYNFRLVHPNSADNVAVTYEDIKAAPVYLHTDRILVGLGARSAVRSDIAKLLADVQTFTKKLEICSWWQCPDSAAVWITSTKAKHLITTRRLIGKLAELEEMDQIEKLEIEDDRRHGRIPYRPYTLVGNPHMILPQIYPMTPNNLVIAKLMITRWKRGKCDLTLFVCGFDRLTHCLFEEMLLEIGVELVEETSKAWSYSMDQDKRVGPDGVEIAPQQLRLNIVFEKFRLEAHRVK